MLAACGGPGAPPKRGVLERDLSGWGFRRYQSVLDIEVWIAKNKAVAHTASYARKSSEKTGHLEERDVVHVFVTRYEEPERVATALVRFVRRLAQQSGYKVRERKIAGIRAFEVQGPSEYWVFWSAAKHVIKVGGHSLEKVPSGLAEAYGDRYSSTVKSGSLEGPLQEEVEPEVEQEALDSESTKPEWQ